VKRVAYRLGLTRHTDPEKIEEELMKAFPREKWARISDLLIWHGRRICQARKPKCGECLLNRICPSSLVWAAREKYIHYIYFLLCFLLE